MRRATLALFLLGTACTAGVRALQETPPPPPPAPPASEYPPTRREEIVEKLHGVDVADPYRWLEDEEGAEVQAWMKAQDWLARSKLSQLPGRDALAKRFRELYYLETISVPGKAARRLFYARRTKESEKATVCWREGAAGAEKVLIDPNTWSPDGTISLGRWVPSHDGRKVAFLVRPNAADEATLKVIDVDSGKTSDVDVIEGAKYASPSWIPSGKGFYYPWVPTDPAIPKADRPGFIELRYHALGADPRKDPVVHPRTGNPSAMLGGSVSRDGRYLFATISRGAAENDVFIKDLKRDRAFRPVAIGKDALYGVRAWKDELYIETNEGAPNGRVFKASAARPDRARWKEIVPEEKDAVLEDASVVGGRLVLQYLRNVSTELRVAALDGRPLRTVTLPGFGSASPIIGLPDDDEGFFSFNAPLTPPRILRTSMKTGQTTTWFEVKVPVDTSPYLAEQVWFASKDGTRVPMLLVRRKDLKKDGATPVLLSGYGGFSLSLLPGFRTGIFPWLEAGGVWAQVNLRGGGEFGKGWHDAGRGRNKQNVFDDFIAAAEFLVRDGLTSPSRIGILGASNGGLLVGAAVTQRPDLFGAAVCQVPLIDMVRYHQFGGGKTWIPEYGTAETEDGFRTLFAYSPYHHVTPGIRYPPLLMMSADKDDRVAPLHARKFVAALQAASPAGTAWLRIEMNAGHGGADQVRRAVESSADQTAFLMRELGMGRPTALTSATDGGTTTVPDAATTTGGRPDGGQLPEPAAPKP